MAAFAVCVTHAAFWAGDFHPDVLGAAYARLETAVPVFFALSGYLLVRPWLRWSRSGGIGPGPDVRDYLRRRAWRIVPAYWIVVSVVYVVYIWRPDSTASGHGPGGYLRHLAFVQIYGVGHVHTGLTQMWSMCVEVAFYLVLPLIGLALMRTARAGRSMLIVPLVMIAVTVGWLVLVTATQVFGKTARSWPPAFAAAFAAGIAVALLIDRYRWSKWWLLGAAALAFAAVMTPISGPIDLSSPTALEGVTKYLLQAAIGGLLVAAFARGRSTIMGSRPMVWLGSISYEYFLIHVIVLDVVALDIFGWSLFQGSTWPIVAVTTVITIPLAWLLHHGVNRLHAAVTGKPVT